jgi:hypothetical protein
MQSWKFFSMSSKRDNGFNNCLPDFNTPSSSVELNSNSSFNQIGNSVIKRLGWKQGYKMVDI